MTAAAISATAVNELRKRTGAGMMECKKALVATNGDLELAVEELRKSGRAKADKKSDRIAAEGAIAIKSNDKQAVMIEINSETDFVARDPNFTQFVGQVAETILQNQQPNVETLANLTISGGTQTVEEARLALVAKVGENVQLRRAVVSNAEPAGCVGTYVHGSRIGVIVVLDINDIELARKIGMHIAASRPLVISRDMVPQDIQAKEKAIYMAQAADSGKPQEIIEKMVIGRLNKFLDEVSLTGQPFVMDPDTTVGTLLNKHRAKVVAFHRFEVGEGIEKVVEDFKDAVMAQVGSSK